MNRQQRRAQQHGKAGRVEMVDLRRVAMPPDFTLAECLMVAQDRITENYTLTRHPYHHLTDNGVIVDADPTLEYLLQRLERDDAYRARAATLRTSAERLIASVADKDVPPAIPVNGTTVWTPSRGNNKLGRKRKTR